MKKKITTIFLTLLLSLMWNFSAHTATCQVATDKGFGTGSLYQMAVVAKCTPITFNENITTITVPFSIPLNSGVTLDGESRITILPAEGFSPASSAIIKLAKTGAVVKNITVSHPGSVAISVTGDQNRIENSIIAESDTGIRFVSGNKNIASGNTFNNISVKEIEIITGNEEIQSAPLTASLYSPNSWVLGGTAAVDLNDAQVYAVAEDLFGPLTDEIDVVGVTFTKSFDLNQIDPRASYSALITDENNNTSAFADVIVPIQADGFFSAMPDCNVEWFKQGLWNSDFDGDSLTNLQEDKNQNCVLDDGECDPADPASKCEVVTGGGGTTTIPSEPAAPETPSTPSEGPPTPPTDVPAAEEEGGGCSLSTQADTEWSRTILLGLVALILLGYKPFLRNSSSTYWR